jgi:phosphorylase kinase alpha/beta subunit
VPRDPHTSNDGIRACRPTNPPWPSLPDHTKSTAPDIARANRELKVDEPLVLDVLIDTAVRLGWEQGGGGAYNEQVAQAWQASYASPPHRVANLIMAAMAFLLSAPA